MNGNGCEAVNEVCSIFNDNTCNLVSQFEMFTEQATDPNLASENWSLNMEICDVINETDDG